MSMTQTEARRLAKTLSDNMPSIYIAVTESQLKGQWPQDPEIWVVIHAGNPGEPIREMPAEFNTSVE